MAAKRAICRPRDLVSHCGARMAGSVAADESATLRDHEHRAVLHEQSDRTTHRRAGKAVFLNQARLAGDRSLRLPVTASDARTQDPSELPVRRDRAVVLDRGIWVVLHVCTLFLTGVSTY